MDINELGKKLDEMEMLASEVSDLIEVTADSCEKNNMTTQETPLRLACTKQDILLDQLRDVNVELYSE